MHDRVASKELCEELFKLKPEWSNNSGTKPKERMFVWQESYATWEMGQGNPAWATTPILERRGVERNGWRVVEDLRWMMVAQSFGANPSHWYDKEVKEIVNASIPAYDISYLMTKLQDFQPQLFYDKDVFQTWVATTADDDGLLMQMEDNPEDAICQLAIRIIKEGFLNGKK